MPPILLRYDLRAPAYLGADPGRQYSAALEQCRWADGIAGIDQVVLSEHHGVEDGYCPSPMVFASAVAARTATMLLVLGALVVPLHDPVRLAEDLAVLDLVSGGRLVVVFAAGYRREEFDMFDRPMAGRGRTMEGTVLAIRAAWRGEAVHRTGDGLGLAAPDPTVRPGGIRVTPLPVQPGGPPVMLGGNSVAAAERAARVGDGFMPGIDDPALGEAYRAERARLGLGPGLVSRADGPMGVFVAEDPDRVWATIAPHALHEARSYHGWESTRPGATMYPAPADAGELRASGFYRVLTPQDCVSYVEQLPSDSGLLLHPLLGGLDPDVGWRSLELFADRVLPELRRRGVMG